MIVHMTLALHQSPSWLSFTLSFTVLLNSFRNIEEQMAGEKAELFAQLDSIAAEAKELLSTKDSETINEFCYRKGVRDVMTNSRTEKQREEWLRVSLAEARKGPSFISLSIDPDIRSLRCLSKCKCS